MPDPQQLGALADATLNSIDAALILQFSAGLLDGLP